MAEYQYGALLSNERRTETEGVGRIKHYLS
jgi:hypothetical protein